MNWLNSQFFVKYMSHLDARDLESAWMRIMYELRCVLSWQSDSSSRSDACVCELNSCLQHQLHSRPFKCENYKRWRRKFRILIFISQSRVSGLQNELKLINSVASEPNVSIIGVNHWNSLAISWFCCVLRVFYL